jgi:hypothetical protein
MAPIATVPYIACAVAASPGGTIWPSKRIQARCSRAKLSPCRGSIKAIAPTSVVIAITVQRTMPAAAASVIARIGRMQPRRRGPITTNTSTSAPTDSDHNKLAVGGDIPAAFHRIIAKESCMAWLPSTSAAMVSTNLNSRSRKSPCMERLLPELADAIEGRDAAATIVAVAAAARRKADPPQMITFRSTATIA